MISEFMLQQTPVARVLAPWQIWVDRWPTAPALAAAPTGEAVRAWGRLGYPRRALRLHAAATMITDEYGGEVPGDYAALLALPGVGSYTAAAIASFAFRRRHVVLDTNVRRVLARIDGGEGQPPAALSVAEEARAHRFLPRTGPRAARWAVASMELGALICTARTPHCDGARWRSSAAGTDSTIPSERCRPAAHRRTPVRIGSVEAPCSRCCARPTGRSASRELAAAWPDAEQRQRGLSSLHDDGLITSVDPGHYALPSCPVDPYLVKEKP